MITLNIKGAVKDNSVLVLNLPKSLPNGEYDMLLVIDETPRKNGPLRFMNFECKIDPNQTFRREDMYDDNGR